MTRLSRAGRAPGRASEPGPDLAVDRCRHRLAERHVLVDRRDRQHPCLAVGPGVELSDQPVAVQDREGVVAPPTLGGGLVHLEDVVELEDVVHPLAVVSSRSNGESSAARPANGWPSSAGSTRHSPRPPRPPRAHRPRRRQMARPGTPGPLAGRCRARPACARHAASAPRPREGRGRPGRCGRRGPRAGCGRSHRRPRPLPARRGGPASCVTFLLLFQPLEAHGCTHVSGSSLLGNGPSARRRSRMSRRQSLLVITQSRLCNRHGRTSPTPGHSSISAR